MREAKRLKQEEEERKRKEDEMKNAATLAAIGITEDDIRNT